jgi:anti-sigma regulatory factor (Ser/Thr protein kinase)
MLWRLAPQRRRDRCRGAGPASCVWVKYTFVRRSRTLHGYEPGMAEDGPSRMLFTPRVTEVRAARRFTSDWSRRCGADGLGATLSLVVSELVTNAVEHARSTVELALALVDRTTVRVEVADDGPGQPVVLDPGIGDEAGRGLVIVDGLVDRWGIERDPARPGKRVWAEVRVDHELAPAW